MAEVNKILIYLIYKHRDILFGKFSSTLTHEMKAAKWKDIAEELKAAGIYSKDWKYLRDTTWQNWRKRTMEKKDNRLQTGSGGGKKFKYDDSDELIIKIIGKDSPVIDGMNIPESSGSNLTQLKTTPEPECASTSQVDTSMTNSGSVRNKSLHKNRIRLVSSAEYDEELHILKKQKLEAEIELTKEKTEIAKRERYKLDLELLKLENELQFRQPSSFTMPYITQDRTVIVVEHIEENDSADVLQQAINSFEEND